MGPEGVPSEPKEENPEGGVTEESVEVEGQDDEAEKDDIYTVDGKETTDPLHHT